MLRIAARTGRTHLCSTCRFELALQSRPVDLKRLITHVSYRIEEKPGGGFVAHPYDPDSPPLEAPTRLELNQLIQARNTEMLAKEFPGFKPSQEEKDQLSFHIERRSDGGFTVHSNDLSGTSNEAGSHEELESHLAEKMLGFVAKRMADKLPPEMAAQLNSGDVRVTIKRMMTPTGKIISRDVVVSPSGPNALSTGNPALSSSDVTSSPSVGTITGDSPITPETSRSWPLLRFLLAALVVFLFVYIFMHRR